MYVYLLKNRAFPPPDDTVERFQLSFPGDLDGIMDAAQLMASREHGDDMLGTYEIIELNMSKKEYKQWKRDNEAGSIISRDLVDNFLLHNNEALLRKDKSAINEKVSVIHQGIISPDSFFNKFTGDLGPSLGGRIAAFSANTKVSKEENLENTAANQIESLGTPTFRK